MRLKIFLDDPFLSAALSSVSVGNQFKKEIGQGSRLWAGRSAWYDRPLGIVLRGTKCGKVQVNPVRTRVQIPPGTPTSGARY